MARTYEFYVVVTPAEQPRGDQKYVARVELFEVVDGNQHRLDAPSQEEFWAATAADAREKATARAQEWIEIERARHEAREEP
jgi:hypothetical protein